VITQQTRVLVADDDPVSQLVVTTALEATGYTVLAAADGIAAAELFESDHPDCVILDVMMPGLDGFAACRRIRALPRGRDVPILILTGRDDINTVSRAYDAGATDFLAKGSSHRLLTERVRFLLRAHEAWRALVVSEGRLRVAQAMARVGHWELDSNSMTVDLSETVADILAITSSADSGLGSLRAALADDDLRLLDEQLAGWRRTGEPFRLDGHLRNGTWVHIQGASTAVARDSVGGSLTLAIQDVTLLRQAQQEAHRLAHYDALTGLSNRRRFSDNLATLVREQREPAVAVLAVRVRGQERILESIGQAAADRVVVAASQRLHAAASEARAPCGALAHLDGGDFALAFTECDPPAAAAVAEQLLAVLAPPVEGGGWTVNLLTQIGIALSPRDGQSADELLANAQATAGRGTADTGSGFGFFAPEFLARARRRMELEAALRGALERDEFTLVYQPRVDLGDLSIRGAEALLRWNHPELGAIPPLEFISIAEESGLIVDIGNWTLDRACRQAAAWRRTFGRAFAVSVNVSPQQLTAPHTLLASTRAALDRNGLPASALELELTESMIIHAAPDVLSVLEQIRKLGVSLALDDFGTGYSSLGYLRKLPVDCLKIDRAFVSDLAEDASAEGVLEAILALARALRLRTVAEGIETAAQFQMLATRGCLEGQGYLFSKPVAPAKFAPLLAGGSLSVPPGMRASHG
jgi:predicted signal transduction protein with EAL and GGDEF domain/DNA-binding response OmpR family regulator